MGLVGLVLLWPGLAVAERTFPAELQKALGLPCTPDCIICHLTSPGMAGNFMQKLATTLLQTTKIVHGKPSSIVDAIKADVADSDGDGTLDIDELKQTRNPNIPAPGDDMLCPRYGCAASLAPPAPTVDLAPGAALIAAAVVGVLALRRRSRGGRAESN